MIDVNKLLNTVLAVTRHHGKATRKSDYRSTAVDARASAISSPAMWAYSETGALAGGLAGTLLTSKHARKLGGSALQIGAVALLGGLAYKAYSNYRDGKPLVPQNIRDALGGLSPQQASAAQPAPDICTVEGNCCGRRSRSCRPRSRSAVARPSSRPPDQNAGHRARHSRSRSPVSQPLPGLRPIPASTSPSACLGYLANGAASRPR